MSNLKKTAAMGFTEEVKAFVNENFKQAIEDFKEELEPNQKKLRRRTNYTRPKRRFRK